MLFGRNAALAVAILTLFSGSAIAGPLSPAPSKVADADYLSVADLRAKYAKPEGKYFIHKGVEVYYTDEGSGSAILMVHGSSSSLMTYDGLAAALKANYRVIRYDIPPFGLSGPVSDKAAAELKQVDLPIALLEKLGVEKVTVVGVSSGGTMAYYLAAARPDMVERIVLSNAPADVVDTTPMPLSKALAEEEAITGPQANGTYKRRSFWDAFFDFFTGEPERVGADVRDQFYDINRRAPEKNRFAVTALTADNAFTRAEAAKVTSPVLLLWGERDPLLPSAAAKVLADYLKNAPVSTVLMPDVGHYPPIESPDRFAQILRAYIEAATPVKPVAKEPADR